MRLFRRLCCIAVVFMLFFNIAMATELIDTDPADPPPASTHPPETEDIDDPGEPDDPGETEEPEDPEEPVDPEEPDDTTESDDDEDDLDEADEEDEALFASLDAYDIYDVYKVILPTSTGLDFTLDPIGLSALEDDGIGKTLEELKAGPKAGSVDFRNYTPVIINASSFDLLVKLDMSITGDATVVSTASAAINPASEEPYLFINMTVSNKQVTNPDADALTFTGNVDIALEDDTLGTQVSLFLKSAEYIVNDVDGENIYEMVDNTEDGTQLLFGGACNPYGKWIDFVDIDVPASKKVGINVVFTFEKAIGTYTTHPSAHGLVTDWTPPEEPDGVGFMFEEEDITKFSGPNYGYLLSVQKAHMTITRGPVVVPFYFGDYVLESFRVYNNRYSPTPYELVDGGISIDFSAWPIGGPSGYDIWIQLSNGKWYAIWFTINAP